LPAYRTNARQREQPHSGMLLAGEPVATAAECDQSYVYRIEARL